MSNRSDMDTGHVFGIPVMVIKKCKQIQEQTEVNYITEITI